MTAEQKKLWADLIRAYPKSSSEASILVALYSMARRGLLQDCASVEEIVQKLKDSIARVDAALEMLHPVDDSE